MIAPSKTILILSISSLLTGPHLMAAPKGGVSPALPILAQAPPAPPSTPAPAAAPAPVPAPPQLETGITLTADSKPRRKELAFQNVEDLEIPEPGGASWAFTGDQGFQFDVLGDPNNAKTRSLVLRSGDMDPKTVTDLEEDLNVMSRILSKSAKEKGGEQGGMTAMGVKIRTLTLGAGRAVQNAYLDGYGAVFFLGVGIPLLPPAEKPAEEPKKETGDPTWEEAKREVYGSKAPGRPGAPKKGRPVEYNADKVAELKDTLVQRLKNAANIRGLKPSDFVTIVVSSSASANTIRFNQMTAVAPVTAEVSVTTKSKKDFDGKGDQAEVKREIEQAKRDAERARRDAEREMDRVKRDVDQMRRGPGIAAFEWRDAVEPSQMIVRARRSDIDAFAKGGMDLEAFKKTVQISVY